MISKYSPKDFPAKSKQYPKKLGVLNILKIFSKFFLG
jgi:hypothetical protein